MASKVPDQMQAAQVVEVGKPYKINQVAVPKDLAEHDLLLKVAVASLCHTDFMVRDGVFGTNFPRTGSHEGAGTVIAVGSSVRDFKVGDRVMAGLNYGTCGTCFDCLHPDDFHQYCTSSGGALGISRDGFFAEYARVDSRTSARMPDAVSFETAAPLACAGCTVFRGVLQAGVKKGEWLAIVGSGGGLGHLGVKFAKALGLNVVGVDARDEGLELTKRAGADVIVDARIGHKEAVQEVKKITNGEGVTATVNVSDANSAAATSCAITKMHGTVIQLAQPENVSIPFPELIFRDIRIRGSVISTPKEARQMLDVVAEHGISVETNAFNGLGEIERLVELAEGGKMKGKGILIMDPEQLR